MVESEGITGRTTLAETRYLHLKLSSDLTADAKSNLEIIDSLGAATNVSSEGDLLLRAVEDIVLQPQSGDIGGGGSGGSIFFGDEAHPGLEIESFADSFLLNSGLSLANQATSSTNKVTIEFNDAVHTTLDQTVSLSFGSGNRTLTAPDSGKVLVQNTVTGVVNLAGELPIDKGGTGQSTAPLAVQALLEGATSETYAANQNQILGINAAGTGLEWKTAGSGIVEAITTNAPVSINNTVPAFPVISIPKAATSVDGYLSATDWTTFNNKADALPNGGTAGTFLRGDNSWSVVNTDNVTELAGATNKWFRDDRAQAAVVASVLNSLDTTHSPSSSVVANQLSFREPTIVAGTAGQYWRGDKTWQTLNTDVVSEGTAQYFTAQRVRDAAIVQTVTDGDTTHAPSADAVYDYVGSAISGGTYTADWTSGTSFTATHGFNSRDVTITVYEKDLPWAEIYVDSMERNSITQVTLTSSTAPTGSGWRVLVRK